MQDGQPLRYVCRSRDGSAVFFVVIFTLEEVEESTISLEPDETIGTQGKFTGKEEKADKEAIDTSTARDQASAIDID